MVWYNGGNTAYIEPVATVPERRGKGLGRAVVYEAVNRAKERGAKRAIVLSDQDLRRKNMKNFSMPKQVSPTLEIDELMRLKHSLEKNVSREVAESAKSGLLEDI